MSSGMEIVVRMSSPPGASIRCEAYDERGRACNGLVYDLAGALKCTSPSSTRGFHAEIDPGALAARSRVRLQPAPGPGGEIGEIPRSAGEGPRAAGRGAP